MRMSGLMLLTVILIGCVSRSSNDSAQSGKSSSHPDDDAPSELTHEEQQDGVNRDVSIDPYDTGAVQYGPVSTPWDFCFADLSHDDEKGIRFDLVWSGPGTLASEEEWEQHKAPKRGEVVVAVIHNGKIVAEPEDNPPAIYGWAGGGLGTSGDMMMFFGWLPPGLGDCWIRVDLLDERHWFLVPRELHQKTQGKVTLKRPTKDEVVPPATADSDDKLHW